MPDFKRSFEQRRWESAASSHARWSTFLNTRFPKVREYAEKRISEIEVEYPQLKQKGTL